MATFRDIVTQYLADVRTALRTANYMSVMRAFSEKAIVRVDRGKGEEIYRGLERIREFHKSLPRGLEEMKIKVMVEDMSNVRVTYEVAGAPKKMSFSFDSTKKILSARLEI